MFKLFVMWRRDTRHGDKVIAIIIGVLLMILIIVYLINI